MFSISSSPLAAPPPATYSQVGQIPVGQESAQQRLQRIRPVEQTPAAAAGGEQKRPPLGAGRAGEPVDKAPAVSDEDKRKQARQTVQTKLDQKQLEQLKQLAARDREVRAHEQAHKAVAGSYAGAISYEYERGPDGNRYAVAGEVAIDTSPESSPEETLIKARVIQQAANAPAEPSDQDRAVAAQAAQMEQEALVLLAQQLQVGQSPRAGVDDANADSTQATTAAKDSSVGEGGTVAKASEGAREYVGRQEQGIIKKLGQYEQDAATSLHFYVQA